VSDGFQFTVAYTFAKTFDWCALRPSRIPEYLYLNEGETGAPHRLNASLVYELPFGGGKRWTSTDAAATTRTARRGRVRRCEHVSSAWRSGSHLVTRVDMRNANVLNRRGNHHAVLPGQSQGGAGRDLRRTAASTHSIIDVEPTYRFGEREVRFWKNCGSGLRVEEDPRPAAAERWTCAWFPPVFRIGHRYRVRERGPWPR
jgi:hypothetical protein